MKTIRQPTTRDILKLTTLGAIWASAFMCIEVALTDFSPLAIAAWRISIGALALAPMVLLRRGQWPRGSRTWLLVFLAGALYNAVPFSLISWGQQYVSSGMTALLMSCGPFVALALSHVLTPDDRFTLGKLGGVVLGFSGVVVLVGEQALEGSGGAVVGQLAMVAAVSCYALSSLIVRRIVGVGPLTLSFVTLASSAIYMLPLLFVSGEPFPPITSTGSLTALLFLGFVPTAAAYVIRVQIVQQVGATFLSQVSFYIPPFGLLWSWLFLDQVPRGTIWVALALILCGLLVSRMGARGAARSAR